MLTVHGRTRADRFLGRAEYRTIAEIVAAVSIPVIANGDIDSTDKARAVLEQTGATGVMIGRAAQGNLWLPGAIARALASGGDAAAPSFSEQLRIHQRHIARLHDFHGDHLGPKIARKHHTWFLQSLASQALISTNALRDGRQTFNALESSEAQIQHLAALAEQGSGLRHALPRCRAKMQRGAARRMSAAKDSPSAKRRKATKADPRPLKDSASEAIEHFLKTLDGEPCSDLYDMVLQQVEAPLFKAVLEYTQHNQSHAATMLGLNRGTLRKKLRQHGLLNEPEPPKRKRSSRTPKSPASKTATNKTATKRKR